MLKGLVPLVVIAAFAAFPACGNGSDCADEEIELDYSQGEKDTVVECVATPAECGNTASCADPACATELYKLCNGGYTGTDCSDDHFPTIISCNL